MKKGKARGEQNQADAAFRSQAITARFKKKNALIVETDYRKGGGQKLLKGGGNST